MKNKIKSTKTNSNNINLINLLYLIIIFIIFINKGSYFPKDYYISLILISSILLFFIIYSQYNKLKIKITKEMNFNISLIFLITFFIISLIFSSYKRITLDEISKWIVSIFILYFIYNNIKNDIDRIIYQYGFIIFGLISSIIGILSYYNIIKIPSAVINNRISSFLQYPNTYASFLSTSIILSITFLFEEKNLIYKFFCTNLIVFLSICLFLTGSRGGYIIFIFTILLFPIYYRNYLLNIFKILFYTILIPFIFSILQNLINPTLSFILIFLSIGILLLIKEKSLKYYEKYKALFFSLILLILIFVVYFFKNNFYIERILSLFNIKTYLGITGLSQRTGLIYTALKIFKDHLFLGSGLGTYQFIYMKYRPTLFYSKFPHSTPFQFLSEGGIFGFIIYSVFIINILILIIRYFKKNDLIIRCFILSILYLILHSFIDFDMSIPFIAYYLFTLIGIIFSFEKDSKKIEKKLILKNTFLYPISIILIFLLFINMAFYFGAINHNKSIILKNNEYYEDALSYSKNSIILDSFNSEYHNNNGELLMNIGFRNKDINYLKLAKDEFIKAVNLNKSYFIYYVNLALVEYSLSEKEESIKNLKIAIELNPLDPNNYYNLAVLYKNLNDYEKSKEYLLKTLNLDKNFVSAENTLREVLKNYETEKINIKILYPKNYMEIKDKKIIISWEKIGYKEDLEFFAIYYKYNNKWNLIGYTKFFENSYNWILPENLKGQIELIIYARDKNSNTLAFDKVIFTIK